MVVQMGGSMAAPLADRTEKLMGETRVSLLVHLSAELMDPTTVF
jgi:hypothetical protein